VSAATSLALGEFGEGLLPAFQNLNASDRLPGAWRLVAEVLSPCLESWREERSLHEKPVSGHVEEMT
jgi:hypothetical protein